MDRLLHDFDWSLVKAFLAVAETGSLSAAARKLKTSQPTLGRQIKSMERHLKAELFNRKPRGLELTSTGRQLLAIAKEMEQAARQLTLTAAGQQEQLEGTVRVTSSVWTSTIHLPPIIAEIRRKEPQIAIELVATDQSHNLLFREADIAVRMYRPDQLDLVTQHIGDIHIGIFAAKSYLAERGLPQTLDELTHHDFVGYDRNNEILNGFKKAGFSVERDFFKIRCDDNIAYWELVRSGCGIGFAQTAIGRKDPAVQEIKIELAMPTLPIWLTAHSVMRQTPRIRRVWEYLVEGLRQVVQ